MNNIGSNLYSREVVCNTQSSILVAMPIYFDISTLNSGIRDNFILNESEQFSNSIRSHMAAGITNTNSVCTQFDRSGVYLLDFFRLRAGGIFCYKHHRNVIIDGKRNRFLSRTKNSLHSPTFGKLSNRTSSKESTSLNLPLVLGLQIY